MSNAIAEASPDAIGYEAIVEDAQGFTALRKIHLLPCKHKKGDFTEDECDVGAAGIRHPVSRFKKHSFSRGCRKI